MNEIKINPKNRIAIKKEIRNIPGDKSISHRTAILAALANGVSMMDNFLFSEDCLNTIKIFQNLGVQCQVTPEKKQIKIIGVGLNGLKQYQGVLDVGNSGTGIRLISGVLAGQSFTSQIKGDDSIAKRPMRRIIEPLSQMGAQISGTKITGKDNIYPPLTIQGQNPLKGINYRMPVASAQVKSAILLASLFTEETVNVTEPTPCRDHTERLLQQFGVSAQAKRSVITTSGPKKLTAPNNPIQIPSDISSAAFFMVYAALMPETELVLHHIGLNPTRIGVLTVLEQMGATIQVSDKQETPEPYGTIRVKTSALKNISIEPELIPNIIDEIPILAIAAHFAEGEMSLSHAAELRLKESDRILQIVKLVRALGGSVQETPDGFAIQGTGHAQDFEYDAENDHRMAMAAVIAARIGNVHATIHNCEGITTSFPNFEAVIKEVEDGAI